MSDSEDYEADKKKILDEQKQKSAYYYGDLTTDEFEKELIKKYYFKATKDTEDLYYYDDKKGVYVKGGEWLIKQECLKFNPGIPTKAVVQIKDHIIWGNYIDRSSFDPDIEWLCCKNVMVNLLSGEIKPHDPQYLSTVQIPHDYKVNRMPCLIPSNSKIIQFFHQVMTYEDVETVLDFIAYCLWRDFPFHHWLLLNGSGRNGKGVTTYIIRALLGPHNVSNETLHRLLERTFSSAKLYGKMANIDADLSSRALKETGLLKKLTGGDGIPGEFKFKNPFEFVNYAKLIFSANTIPQTPDGTDAFFARLLIINFPNQFLGDKADPHLKEKLTTEEEMSIFLGILLRRLPRFCIDKGLPKESSQTLSRRLTEYGLSYKQDRRKEGRPYVWQNIKLKDYKQIEDEDQQSLF